MNIQSLLEHHGIIRNPFAEEDAQTDQVFKEHCIANAYHPVWDKVYGDPTEPSTAIVFGPKGSGKTAMRLQILRHLNKYNQEHPGQRVYTVAYDDFNPFLDHFSERMSRAIPPECPQQGLGQPLGSGLFERMAVDVHTAREEKAKNFRGCLS